MTEYAQFLPREQTLQVFLNNEALGSLQDYRLEERREQLAVRAFGLSEPVAFVPGEKSFHLTLKRLLLNRPELPAWQNLYDLTDFTLRIQDAGRSLSLGGCRWCAVTESCTLAQGLVEELQLTACSCSRTAL